MLDFMNTGLVLRDLVVEEELSKDGVGFRLERLCERGVLIKHITVKDGADEHRFEERVQALTPEQLEAMARDAGFVVEDRTDGPDTVPFDPLVSQRFVLWLRKPTP